MKRNRWRQSVGSRPFTVIVEERQPGGNLYVRIWDPANQRWKRRSLGYKDREAAMACAAELHAKLRRGVEDIRASRITLERLFRLYRMHRTPRKSAGEQQEDLRRIEMWYRFLGEKKNPQAITRGEWERFIDQRSSGEIDARGNPVPDVGDRRGVRARTVECDLKWLRYVFGWAVTWQDREGRYLMRENPVRGRSFEIPREKNVRRPWVDRARYDALRMVSNQVRMGERSEVRSHLSELIDLAFWTGRRISAICQLTYGDLRLGRTEKRPFGAIRWPGQTDKEGREWTVALSPEVRAAIDRILAERPGLGNTPLFPSPSDPQKPVTRYRAARWLGRCERLAGLEPQDGSAWHAFRRGWATMRKHLADADVMAAGGWRSVQALKQSYQHADDESVLDVVLVGSAAGRGA
jgi:integrase